MIGPACHEHADAHQKGKKLDAVSEIVVPLSTASPINDGLTGNPESLTRGHAPWQSEAAIPPCHHLLLRALLIHAGLR